MDFEFALNIFDAVIILGVGIPCVYIATKIPQRKLRLLTILLATFLVVHGLYHATSALGPGGLSDWVIEPLGWTAFLAFAVYLERSG